MRNILRSGRGVTAAALLMLGSAPAFAQSAPQAGSATPPIPLAQGNPGAPGVPFPIMLKNPPAAALPGGVTVPLASQPMSMDNKQVDATLNRMDHQDNVRLGHLEVGSGVMNPPDTKGYQSELDQMAQAQREVRLLQLKQQQADLAMKLWATIYDPRRENAAAAHDAPTAKPQSSATTAPTLAASSASVTRTSMDTMLPLPKTVSITGERYSASGKIQSLHAVLLVPYTGEVDARVGTELPGNREVVAITPDGVYVADPKLGRVILGYGDSVPLSPPVMAPAPQPIPGSPTATTP